MKTRERREVFVPATKSSEQAAAMNSLCKLRNTLLASGSASSSAKIWNK